LPLETRPYRGGAGFPPLQFAPDQIGAALSLEFMGELRAPEIERAVVRIARQAGNLHPQIVAMFVTP
jgi:hypothetical protein